MQNSSIERLTASTNRSSCGRPRLAAGGATLAGLACAFALGGAPAMARPVDEGPPAGHSKAVLANLQSAFTAIAEELEPAVVTVSTSRVFRADKEVEARPRAVSPPGGGSRLAKGTGSGVIIRKDGWILTNDHVVNGADRVTVKLQDGREFVGTVRRDYRSDLALIKVESPTALPTARLGDSDSTRVGHWAIAIGSPYRYEGSFSVGVISSVYRQQRISDPELRGAERLYPTLLQTDAAVNPGNSGGPLVNIDGQVIGINTAIEGEGISGGNIGIAFAIPINAAKFVVEQLMTRGKVSYGLLGVTPQTVTPRQAVALGVNEGAWIDEEPLEDGPAGKAGLHAGDVITAINGKPIRGALDLRTIISHTQPFTSVDITFLRDRKVRTVKATLTEAITPPAELPKPRDPGKSSLGIEVQPITDKLAAGAGLPSTLTGVVVKSIDLAGSSSDVDALTEGSIVVRVNDVATPTMAAYRTATEGLKPGDQVRLVFHNRNGKHFRVVQID